MVVSYRTSGGRAIRGPTQLTRNGAFQPCRLRPNNKIRTMKKQYDSHSQVGYGRPPAEHQFRPGQSGNPSGRPKGARSFKSDLRDELDEVVSITDDNNKTIEVTKQRAIIRTLLRMAIAGDPRAIATIVGSCARALSDDDSEAAVEASEDRAILHAVNSSLPKPRKSGPGSAAAPKHEKTQ
jgi:hypothetical protein